MRVTVRETTVDGLAALAVDAGDVRLVILPELGAKVLSLVWKPTGFEYLWRQPDRPLRLVDYGADFEAADISGWDECFPTIGQAVYPEFPWQGIVAPDHGELWAIPWNWSIAGETLRMWADGVRFPYRFARSFSFADPGRIDVVYEVENRAPYALRALWSMHPFFCAGPDTRILLPAPNRIRVEISKLARLGGFLADHPWPVTHGADGQAVDLSLMGPRDRLAMDKIYSDRLAQGWTALYTPSHQQYVAMTFDPAAVPYVGIAMMRGGWPEEGEPSCSVILEPCTGWPDRLDIAIPRGAAMTIPASATARWSVSLHLGSGRESLETIVGTSLAE
jgi:galactose mutarotase-like enzyme